MQHRGGGDTHRVTHKADHLVTQGGGTPSDQKGGRAVVGCSNEQGVREERDGRGGEGGGGMKTGGEGRGRYVQDTVKA